MLAATVYGTGGACCAATSILRDAVVHVAPAAAHGVEFYKVGADIPHLLVMRVDLFDHAHGLFLVMGTDGPP